MSGHDACVMFQWTTTQRQNLTGHLGKFWSTAGHDHILVLQNQGYIASTPSMLQIPSVSASRAIAAQYYRNRPHCRRAHSQPMLRLRCLHK